MKWQETVELLGGLPHGFILAHVKVAENTFHEVFDFDATERLYRDTFRSPLIADKIRALSVVQGEDKI